MPASIWKLCRNSRPRCKGHLSADPPFGLREVTIGGVRYIGVSWDGTDTLQTPDYTLFDAMIKYETGPWRLQINATNLTDKRHIATCLARGDCFPGIGPTVLGSRGLSGSELGSVT